MSQRHSIKLPKISLHKPSGNARVWIKSIKKHIYLGRYGSPESEAQYDRLMDQYFLSKVESDQQSIASVIHEAGQQGFEPTVSDLATAYAEERIPQYVKNGKPTSEQHVIRLVIKELIRQYGKLKASDFGPRKFKDFRARYANRGLCRSTIKHYCWHVKSVFQLAAENEIIPIDLFTRLEKVKPLPKFGSGATEPVETPLPNQDFLDKCLVGMRPILVDMAMLQALTGMRPGELRVMRPKDIHKPETGSENWHIVLQKHKTDQHTKKPRVIPLGPKACGIIAKYMTGDPEDYCFKPAESYRQHLDRRRKARRTPENCGNRPKGAGKSSFRDHFDKDSYRQAVQSDQKNIYKKLNGINGKLTPEEQSDFEENYRWTPRQLRKYLIDLANRKRGMKCAQQLAAHTTSRTTEKHYTMPDLELAEEFAAEFG